MRKVYQGYKFISINPETDVVCVSDEKGTSQAHKLNYNKRLGVKTFYSKGIQYAVGIEWLTPLIFSITHNVLVCTTDKALSGTVEQLQDKGYSFTFTNRHSR